jgi:MFS transporter, FHS family, glucose/mannose:H+ symporter
MQRPSTTTIFLLTAGCFLAFFVFGFTDNLKGPTLPAMLAEMHINYGAGGNLIFGEYLGFLIATLITGVLADKFGLKAVILLAGVCLLVGVSGYSAFYSTWLLAASLFVVGLGLGALELGPNAIIVNLHSERKGLYLNLMSVLHGLGSMLAPLIAGRMLSRNISWRIIYRWDLLIIAVFILFFIFLRFPRSAPQESVQLNFREIPRIAFKGQMPWFYLSIALYVAAEIGIASWLVTFLQDVRHISVAASSQALSLFFGVLMLGRLLGSFVVQRIGYLRSVLLATIGALTCIAVGLFGPRSLSFFLPLTGLFFSIIFPTLTAAASEAHTESVNTILGVLFTFAGLGGVLGPWLIGLAGDLFGLQAGFGINLIIAVLMLGSVFVLMKGNYHDSKT